MQVPVTGGVGTSFASVLSCQSTCFKIASLATLYCQQRTCLGDAQLQIVENI